MTPPDDPRDGGYWRERPASFSAYYKGMSWLSPRRAVSRFLDRRSVVLLSLLDPRKGTTILDVGCGSGVHLRQLAPSCRRILGVDSSAKMLDLAREELAGEPNWSLQRADAQALPFADRSFDCVISMGLLDYVASPRGVLAECRRVLKDGGSLLFSAPKRPSAFFFLRTRAGDRVKKALFDLPPIENVLGRADLEALLASAGLEALSVRTVWTTMWIVKAVKAR